MTKQLGFIRLKGVDERLLFVLLRRPWPLLRQTAAEEEPAQAAPHVVFVTGGAFTEAHIVAITQAICRYRKLQRVEGPLYLAKDTHALSEPAFASALEVLAVLRLDHLDANGALLWNTFLGGSDLDWGADIALEGENVYVGGSSEGTWGTPVNPHVGLRDIFVARLNSSGALAWNTFLGRSYGDFGQGITLDGSSNVYVVGWSRDGREFSVISDIVWFWRLGTVWFTPSLREFVFGRGQIPWHGGQEGLAAHHVRSCGRFHRCRRGGQPENVELCHISDRSIIDGG